MTVAVYPGSFDPVTLGHVDIIRRAAKMFDRVVVAVGINMEKKPWFTVEERKELLRSATNDIENVEVVDFEGLLVDFARQYGSCVILKGLRAVSDFEYEFQMALTNNKLAPEIETVFLTTSAENMYLSSSVVKQIAAFGGDISSFVPDVIRESIVNRITGVK